MGQLWVVSISKSTLTSFKPKCRGANSITRTLALESVSEARSLQRGALSGRLIGPISSQIFTVLSKEQDAITFPNSGWAQETLHTGASWAYRGSTFQHEPNWIAWKHTFQSPTFDHAPVVSSNFQIFILVPRKFAWGWWSWVIITVGQASMSRVLNHRNRKPRRWLDLHAKIATVMFVSLRW